MHKKLALVLGIVVILCAFIFSLPWLFSSTSGTSILTSFVNQRIPGQIEIQQLQMSWQGNQSVQGLSLKDPKGNEILHVAKIEVDSTLLNLIFQPSRAGNWKMINLQGVLVQDHEGVTNLEGALGLKSFNEMHQQAPVFINNLQAEVQLDPQGDTLAKATGYTQQNELKGEFSLDASFGSTNVIHLNAHQFPVLVLDQTLAIRFPALSGLLLDLLGNSLDVKLEQKDQDGHLAVHSPLTQIDAKGRLENNFLQIDTRSYLAFNWPAEQVEKWLHTLSDNEFLQPLKALNGKLIVEYASLPLHKDALTAFQGKANLVIQENQFRVQKQSDLITLEHMQIAFETVSKNDIQVTIHGNGEQSHQPIALELALRFPKAAGTDSLIAIREGLTTTGYYQGPSGGLTPSNEHLKLSWQGLIREKNTQLKLSLISNQFSLPEVLFSIESLPLKMPFNEIEGMLTFKNVQLNHPSSVEVALTDLTIPWKVESHANSFTLRFTGIKDANPNQEHLKGTLWIDQGKQHLDLANAAIQIQLQIQDLESYLLQPLLPNHSVATVIGPKLNAEVAASRDMHGNLEGRIQMVASKESNALLKNLTGQFSLTHDLRDISFNINTSQIVGKSQIMGTMHDLWDSDGRLRLNFASVSLKGQVQHFPVELMTRLITGDQLLAKQLEAILGSQVNAEITSEVKEQNGPIIAKISGSNGRMHLDGYIQQGVFYLSQPLTASLNVTPQLEQLVISKAFPVFSSAISSNQPIDLKIYPESFSFALASEELTIGKGELDLHKMQFQQSGQLGKIAQFLGIKTNPFEVWITPLFFSFTNHKLFMQRVDLLISNAYPLASWGSINFDRDDLQLVIALSGTALKKAFALSGIHNSYMLHVPVQGPIRNPQINTSQVAMRISALTARESGPQGQLIGSLVDAATDIVGNDPHTPPPTTQLLPWEDLLQDDPENQSTPNKVLEKPLKELKKSAKSLLKGLLGFIKNSKEVRC